VGVVIDGCPPGLEISEEDIQIDLDRRKPGQSSITTQRQEEDSIKIYSGVFAGKTAGTPIMLMAHNKDHISKDYEKMKEFYRPGHADFTYEKKYGLRDWRGSGRASARETLARVAAGAIAKKYLRERLGVEIVSFVTQVGTVLWEAGSQMDMITGARVDSTIVRCPDNNVATKMIRLIEKVKSGGDSVGGVIQGIVRNVPIGLGEPVFDKLHADLGKAMLSINAVKGFEIGDGFGAARLRGSEHNDAWTKHPNGEIVTETNHAGGVIGGISNGMPIVFRVAFKPVSTIRIPQHTVKVDGSQDVLVNEGRHDPCVLPRAVPIVDAMAALVIMDHYLRHKAQKDR
jgi:chorismate synthase